MEPCYSFSRLGGQRLPIEQSPLRIFEREGFVVVQEYSVR
jgi:hypothetical protein